MNKDTIIGFVLIAVVLIAFSWYNLPRSRKQKRLPARQKPKQPLRVTRQPCSMPPSTDKMKTSY